LVGALTDLYSHCYDADPAEVRRAAELRAEAMDVSDAWVGAGCDRDDPRLARERGLLVRSYAAQRPDLARQRLTIASPPWTCRR